MGDLDTLLSDLAAAKNYPYDQDTLRWVIPQIRKGNEEMAHNAERLIEQIESASYNVQQASSTRAVFGPRIAIGEWLAGSPTCFRRRQKSSSVSAVPLEIYVSVGLGSVVTQSHTAIRGAALTALVMKLQQVRPVDLYLIDENVYSDYDGPSSDYDQVIGMTSVRIETRPLNLAQLAFCLTSRNFVDYIIYGTAKWHGHSIRWPNLRRSAAPAAYGRRMMELLGQDNPASCFYIPGIANGEQDQICQNPVAWVNTQLRQYAGAYAEE